MTVPDTPTFMFLILTMTWSDSDQAAFHRLGDQEIKFLSAELPLRPQRVPGLVLQA